MCGSFFVLFFFVLEARAPSDKSDRTRLVSRVGRAGFKSSIRVSVEKNPPERVLVLCRRPDFVCIFASVEGVGGDGGSAHLPIVFPDWPIGVTVVGRVLLPLPRPRVGEA